MSKATRAPTFLNPDEDGIMGQSGMNPDVPFSLCQQSWPPLQWGSRSVLPARKGRRLNALCPVEASGFCNAWKAPNFFVVSGSQTSRNSVKKNRIVYSPKRIWNVSRWRTGAWWCHDNLLCRSWIVGSHFCHFHGTVLVPIIFTKGCV